MIASKPRKIKILQVIYSLEYGGSERLASFLSYSVDRTRYDTSILGLYGGGPITEELNRHHVPFSYFSHLEGPGARFLLQQRLYQFIRKSKIDIIQVHGSYPFTRILPAAKLTNTRVICTLHSKHSLQTVTRLRAMFRLGVLFCDRVVVVSNALQRYVEVGLGIKGSKVIVIHNGVDLKKFNPTVKKIPIPGISAKINPPIRVGVIGRLRDAKDHTGLFKAWVKVMAHFPKIQLILVGDGALRNSLEELAWRLNIGAGVVFLGEREDLPQLISHMDLIVLPSKRESFPITILEAMAMKKPVIATAVGGIPEIIRHGYNGYLVPAQNSDALANAILKFLENRELFVQMAVEGYHTVIAKFNDRVVISKYERIYDEICPV